MTTLTTSLPIWRLPLLRRWREVALALRGGPAAHPMELSERTLDDIGAPGWLRAQARAERDAGAAPALGRQPW